ncbi:hypothetical protein AYI70_g10910 [Smittium culicis]|uniref:Uncharacterized protein n=1 Tax=Smittium culicis TaxID=133412 RepID=A0A1R1X4B2_9FUNG|nr:hypothetical protein AYI70_g10910 [Smittium culicis]
MDFSNIDLPLNAHSKKARKALERNKNSDMPRAFRRILSVMENTNNPKPKPKADEKSQHKNSTSKTPSDSNKSTKKQTLKIDPNESFEHFKKRVQKKMKADLEAIPIVKLPGKEKTPKTELIKSKKKLAKLAEKEEQTNGLSRKQRNRQTRKEKLKKRKRDVSPDPFASHASETQETGQNSSKPFASKDKKIASQQSLIPKFNEHAEAPPIFTFVPKPVFKQKTPYSSAQATKSQDAIRNMVKRTSRVAKITPLEKIKNSKKNIVLSASQSHYLQMERQSAIDKYRMLKKST